MEQSDMGKRLRPEYMTNPSKPNEVKPAEMPMPTTVVLAERKTYCITDPHLAELGAQLDGLEERKKALTRQLNELNLQFVGVVGAMRDLTNRYNERVDVLTNPPLHKHPNIVRKPNAHQAELLDLFKIALAGTSMRILRISYKLVIGAKAEQTHWRSDRGETVVDAYLRRKQELEDAAC
jgi:hypothetical protein